MSGLRNYRTDVRFISNNIGRTSDCQAGPAALQPWPARPSWPACAPPDELAGISSLEVYQQGLMPTPGWKQTGDQLSQKPTRAPQRTRLHRSSADNPRASAARVLAVLATIYKSVLVALWSARCKVTATLRLPGLVT
jgi:hypothetical protein